jgi:hypothetical protein
MEKFPESQATLSGLRTSVFRLMYGWQLSAGTSGCELREHSTMIVPCCFSPVTCHHCVARYAAEIAAIRMILHRAVPLSGSLADCLRTEQGCQHDLVWLPHCTQSLLTVSVARQPAGGSWLGVGVQGGGVQSVTF